MKKVLLFCLGGVLALTLFVRGVEIVSRSADGEGRSQLETALRQAVVACYATEGIYPPDIPYLQTHYGLQIDESRFSVVYDIFADNLMPDITVLERES